MNILFVIPMYFQNKEKKAGGMAHYIFRATAALKHCGHNVTIICGDSKNRVEDFEGIELHRVNTVMENIGFSEKTNYRLGLLYREWKLQEEVRIFCKERSVDIIQYAGHSGNGMFHSVKVPAVMRMSSHMGVNCYLTQEERMLIPDIDFASFLERAAGRRVNAVYTPSRYLAEIFGKLIHRKIYVIEPPFENDVKKPDWTVYEKYLSKQKYLLYAGAIMPSKGSHVLRETVPRLLNKYPDFKFVAVGRCYSQEIKEMIDASEKGKGQFAHRIVYLNELKHDQLYPLMQKSEMVINPTLADNLPNTCIEAMFFKKIVVATDGTSCEQLITDGENGFLAVPGDADSMFEKIVQAIELPQQEKIKMGEKAKRRIERLEPDKTVTKLVSFYKTVIDMYTN